MLAIFTAFLLPDRPESTSFLTEDERKIALRRMNRSSSGDTGAVVNQGKHLSLTYMEVILMGV